MILGGGLLWVWPAAPVCAGGVDAPAGDGSVWTWDLTGGFDSYLHSYALATDDTTETLAEFMLQAGLAGRTTGRGRHRWRTRAEASVGTELIRERLEGDYRLVGDDQVDRARLIGAVWGRQYRTGTDYSRSSDNWEGRLEGRITPWVGRRAKLECRGWGRLIDYRTPSTLEVNYHDTGGGVFVRSLTRGNTLWGMGTRLGRRTYPDSTAIDRDSWSVEGNLDHQDMQGQGVRLYHKSERRRVADETVRPSAWTHWSDLHGTVNAGPGQVYLDLQAEVWRYAEQTDVYLNSTRVEAVSGYSWGDILTATWKLGLAVERLDAGDSPETYTQLGLRGGVESYGSQIGGSLVLEYGHRVYAQGAVATATAAVDLSLLESADLYTDFDYWKIWLMASWQLAARWDLDLMANYEPEHHTEKTDDSALGFTSLRLRWRP